MRTDFKLIKILAFIKNFSYNFP